MTRLEGAAGAGVSGHTPGPWWLVEGFDHFGQSRQRVYSVHGNDTTPTGLPYEFAGLARVPACEGDAKLEANARLIAAAPDGLAFAMALDAHWSECVPHGPGEPGDLRIFDEATLVIWRQCRAFIKKAVQQ